MKITRFEDVEAWKAARALMGQVHELTRARAFAAERGLVDQIRRCAVSAMSNIAEGFDAGSDREFRRFLRIARRSLSELQSHLYVALDLKLIPGGVFQAVYDRTVTVKRLIGGFIRYLKAAEGTDRGAIRRRPSGDDAPSKGNSA